MKNKEPLSDRVMVLRMLKRREDKQDTLFDPNIFRYGDGVSNTVAGRIEIVLSQSSLLGRLFMPKHIRSYLIKCVAGETDRYVAELEYEIEEMKGLHQ